MHVRKGLNFGSLVALQHLGAMSAPETFCLWLGNIPRSFVEEQAKAELHQQGVYPWKSIMRIQRGGDANVDCCYGNLLT